MTAAKWVKYTWPLTRAGFEIRQNEDGTVEAARVYKAGGFHEEQAHFAIGPGVVNLVADGAYLDPGALRAVADALSEGRDDG